MSKLSTIVSLRFLLIFFACSLTVTGMSQSVLAGWDCSVLTGGSGDYGPSPYAATTSNSGLTVVGLTRGAGVNTSGTGAGNAWGGNGWNGHTTIADAITAEDYVTFSITVNTGFGLSVKSIKPYNIRRSGSGPTTGQWQYQVDAGSFVNIGSTIVWGSTTSSAGNNQSAINLSSIGDLQNLAAASVVTFRIVNTNASGSAGSWYINDPDGTTPNDFEITGAVVAHFYSKSTGDLSDFSNWGINPAGDGTAPLNFTDHNQVFHLDNRTGTVDLTTAAASINMGGKLLLANSVTLAAANKLVLKSDATGTGIIGTIPGTSNITGEVKVERFIPAGKRAYRQLSGGVNSTSNIYTNWQENGGTTSGIGMHITGSTTGADGFDQTITGAASMYTYTPGAPNFTSIPNTNATNLKALQGYRVFVIGDRNADLTIANNTGTGTPNIALNSNVTLRATGSLATGTVTYNSTGATANGSTDNSITLGATTDDFAMIANPYWSPVDWEALTKSNVYNTYWIWDPTLGNRGVYVSYTSTIGNNNGGSAMDKDIQPGQAIFVRTSAASPSITFEETHKTSEFTNTFRAANLTPSKMRIYLYTNTALASNGSMQDGATVAFRDDFSAAISVEDAAKFTNTDENIAIVRGTSVLGLEGRPTVTAADTIPLRIWRLYSNNQYTLKLDGMDFDAGITGILVDKKLNQEHVLNMSGNITLPFTFTASDSSSYYDRFMLVFRPAATLPVNFTNVKAAQKNTGIQVEWNVAAEVDVVKYEVEKSTNGTVFDKAGTVTASNSKAYNWYDAMPNNGNNYYRIKVTNKDNTTSYSNVVNVKLGNTKGDIVSVYPNPIKGNVLNVQFNNLEKGTYTVQLFNQTGQQVFSRSMSTDGGNMNQAMQLNKLAAGVYNLVVTGTQGIISTQKIIKEN